MTVQALPVRRKLHSRAREGRIPVERKNIIIPKGFDHPLLPVPLKTSPNLQWHLCSVPSKIPDGS
ncbi:hypothetical protein E2C01_070176 [Portunus trituberculatus]|uniref:Uncharacterized protein n=1 Tax=Portunus trituberculatus TaxID=210409 RepID=A0A5B7HS10_PORTR|nr:hypothetical protein [Portunus trituberculatus]